MNLQTAETAPPQTAQCGAPVWRRFAALFYDLFLLVALSMAYGGLVIFLYVLVTGDTGEEYRPMFDSPLFSLGWVAVLAGFYCYFWRKGGQTLGMRAWRLQLSSANGGRPTLKQCLLRSALGPLALSLGGAGYWWRWLDPQRDCLHDRLSETRVLVTEKR